jgi:hypothetical protein
MPSHHLQAHLRHSQPVDPKLDQQARLQKRLIEAAAAPVTRVLLQPLGLALMRSNRTAA